MATPAIIEHGDLEFEFPDPVITRRRDDTDTLVTQWQTPSPTSFSPDGSPPGYPGMTILTVETTKETENCHVHRLSCEGFFGSKPTKRIRRTTRSPSEGWDSASETYITRTPNSYALGDGLSGFGNMYAVDVEKDEGRSGIWWVTVQYQGILASKNRKRRITVNEQISSPSEPAIVDLPDGGWDDARKSSISMPRVVVVDQFISTVAPDTDGIPGNKTPPSPPSLRSLSAFGADVVYNWPHGWKLAAIDSDQIPGKSIWLVTETYEYVWETQF